MGTVFILIISIVLYVWWFIGSLNLVDYNFNKDKRELLLSMPWYKMIILSLIMFSPIYFIVMLICYLIVKFIEVAIKRLYIDKLYVKIYNWLWEINK